MCERRTLCWGSRRGSANSLQQALLGKRFLDERDARIKNPLMADKIFGVSGHIEHFGFGTTLLKVLREFFAGHLGHDDVGE